MIIYSWLELKLQTGNYPHNHWGYFISLFTNEQQVAPRIVVRRLQKESYIPYNRFNILKTKYEIETGEHLE